MNEKYYDHITGLRIDPKIHGNWWVTLFATDKLLGAKITSIKFNMEENLPEIIIQLDTGKQIEIYKMTYGMVRINSD